MQFKSGLAECFCDLLVRRCDVEAVVLFGSMSRGLEMAGAADEYSDIDLHVITRSPAALEGLDWSTFLPSSILLHQCIRPALGGVRKITLLFSTGEVDLVILPKGMMIVARFLVRTGLSKSIPRLAVPMNNLATIMGGGYRFLKGERSWGRFYAEVVNEFPGFRIHNQRIVEMANVAISDMLWIRKKVARGELIAAQRVLHRFILETNIELLHELRLRRGEVTFQQARRVEMLLSRVEVDCIRVSAVLEEEAILRGVITMYRGLRYLLSDLVPEWSVGEEIELRILG